MPLRQHLGVSVEDVLDVESTSTPRRPGPVGRAQKAFEKVARLPRRQQDKIIENGRGLRRSAGAQGELTEVVADSSLGRRLTTEGRSQTASQNLDLVCGN